MFPTLDLNKQSDEIHSNCQLYCRWWKRLNDFIRFHRLNEGPHFNLSVSSLNGWCMVLLFCRSCAFCACCLLFLVNCNRFRWYPKNYIEHHFWLKNTFLTGAKGWCKLHQPWRLWVAFIDGSCFRINCVQVGGKTKKVIFFDAQQAFGRSGVLRGDQTWSVRFCQAPCLSHHNK